MNSLIILTFRKTHKFWSLRDLLLRSDITAFTLNLMQSSAKVPAAGLDLLFYTFIQTSQKYKGIQDQCRHLNLRE